MRSGQRMTNSPTTNKSLEEIAALLRGGDDFLLLTHRRPDGDTIGSAAAICRALCQLGKTAWLAPNCDLTPKYRDFVEGLTAPEDFAPRWVLAVDIADAAALLPENLQAWAGNIDVAIDHHPSNKYYAAHTHVRASAAATGEIVYELCRLLEVRCDRPMWEALYLAISTDTGCFRFSNTTVLCHKIAADAMTNGIDFHKINTEFFSKKTRERISIERSLFDHLIFSADGKVAGSYLSRALINQIGATEDDLDNLSTLIVNVEGLSCAILITESSRPEGEHKVSVRTHKPVDASKICGRFGGGGHARAAGCMVGGDLREALALLMEAAGEEHTLAGGHA